MPGNKDLWLARGSSLLLGFEPQIVIVFRLRLREQSSPREIRKRPRESLL